MKSDVRFTRKRTALWLMSVMANSGHHTGLSPDDSWIAMIAVGKTLQRALAPLPHIANLALL